MKITVPPYTLMKCLALKTKYNQIVSNTSTSIFIYGKEITKAMQCWDVFPNSL